LQHFPRDTVSSVSRFLSHFRRLNLKGHQIAREQGFHLQRINNNASEKRDNVYCNHIAEWWDAFARLVER
jgi:hypothetical protein